MAVALALLTLSSALAATPETPVISDAPIGAGIQIFDVGKLDRAPVAKFRATPQYPAAMHRANIEGEVLVDFVVNQDGNVVHPVAVKSSHPEFNAAAITAVSKWKFRPGMKGGRAVNTHMQVPIAFALED